MTSDTTSRPEVVCLCGSVRFAAELRAATRELSLAGVVVLAPSVLPGDDDAPLSAEQVTTLRELHLRKIELADRVLVVNPGGYVGETTSREISHARASGIPVTFTDPV